MDNRHTIYLIRHLRTTGNVHNKYNGWTDDPILDDHGLQALTHWTPETVYGSDLRRTKETATVYFPNARFIADERLRECHFGDFENKTYEELKEDADYKHWISNLYEHMPRGGESFIDVRKRVIAALKELPSNSVVVTHGGPIRVLLQRFSPEVTDIWSWTVENGSIWKFEWETADCLKEEKRCISLSAVPTTEKGTM